MGGRSTCGGGDLHVSYASIRVALKDMLKAVDHNCRDNNGFSRPGNTWTEQGLISMIDPVLVHVGNQNSFSGS